MFCKKGRSGNTCKTKKKREKATEKNDLGTV